MLTAKVDDNGTEELVVDILVLVRAWEFEETKEDVLILDLVLLRFVVVDIDSRRLVCEVSMLIDDGEGERLTDDDGLLVEIVWKEMPRWNTRKVKWLVIPVE